MHTILKCLRYGLLPLLFATLPLISGAQTTLASRVPDLIASTQCSADGRCVRRMQPLQQFETWQQTLILHLLAVMPAPAGDDVTKSCSTHGDSVQFVRVCTISSPQGTCSCIHTHIGGGCVGSLPKCF